MEESSVSQNEKPKVGERAEQLVDEAFRYVKLTRECAAITSKGEPAPHGPVAEALFVRTALISLVVHYNLGGGEVVDMARFAAWRLAEENTKRLAAMAKEAEDAERVG